MNTEQKVQLAKQKEIWNKYSDGWKKWNELMTKAMHPTTEKLAELLKLKGDENILDVASGPGEPGLSLCKLLPKGSVSAVDLSEQMVQIANENSKEKNARNYLSQVADASDLPFPDDHFDHVISRFGIMFFPDAHAGLKEMTRVLKPGGRLAVLVWAAPELNSFLSLLGRIIMEKINMPPSPPDAPGIFRYAKPGSANQLLIDTGLTEVKDMNVKGQIVYDSPEQFWQLSYDVAGPMMEALKKEPVSVMEDVKTKAVGKAKNFLKDGKVQLDWNAILVSGIKK